MAVLIFPVLHLIFKLAELAIKTYINLLRDVLANGAVRDDRTGTGTHAVFGRQIRIDLAGGFPLLTTKKLHHRSIVHELLWFLGGSTNIAYLHENKVSIWDEWADADGELGPVYGAQWRNWKDAQNNSHDQISNLIETIRNDPHSRRMLVSAWNVGALSQMNLQPCHAMFQVWVQGSRLSLQLYQRSADLFLGVPFNIASYALLTHMLAQATDLQAGEFIHTFGDVHLYANHLDQANEQLAREPRPLPKLLLNPEVKDIFAFKASDIKFEGYNPHPSIKAAVSV